MLFELRQYRILPGQRDTWVRFMEDVLIPFQVSKGMVIVGSFVAEEDDDLYVWIRDLTASRSASSSTRRSTRATTGRARSRPASRRCWTGRRWSSPVWFRRPGPRCARRR